MNNKFDNQSLDDIFFRKKSKSNLDLMNTKNKDNFSKLTINNRAKTSEESKK